MGINIEVAYALPEEQTLISLEVASGTTVEEAITQSGILEKHPEISEAPLKVGIFSKSVSLNAQVRENDRIEIYRPLFLDPKERRRQRAS